MFLDQAGQPFEQFDVFGNGVFDAGANDLDHHVVAVAQAGGVHLGARGRGQRGSRKFAEHLLPGAAQRLFDKLLDGGRTEPRYLVLQGLQFVGQCRRQEVATGRKQLAELDVDGSQLLQRQAQAHFGSQTARWMLSPWQAPQGKQQTGNACRLYLRGYLVEAVAGGGVEELQQSGQMGHVSSLRDSPGMSRGAFASTTGVGICLFIRSLQLHFQGPAR